MLYNFLSSLLLVGHFAICFPQHLLNLRLVFFIFYFFKFFLNAWDLYYKAWQG